MATTSISFGQQTITVPTDGFIPEAHVYTVLDSGPAFFRPLVTPTIATVPTGEITLDAGAAATVSFARVTIQADDQVAAAQRLMDTQPEVVPLAPDSVKRLRFSAAITSLALVGVGSITNAAGHVIILGESTLANVLAAQTLLVFDSADDVREVIITVLPTMTSAQKAQIMVQGVSYA